MLTERTDTTSGSENEGESPARPDGSEFTETPLTGSDAQIEWANAIRRRVNEEFDRVAAAFRSVAHGQPEAKQRSTEAIIAILEEKRREVLSQERAGYFIQDWQEISDQVRLMIHQDPRYQALKSERLTPNK